MKITAVQTIPVAYPESNDSGRIRHLLFVKLVTDDDQAGWGEAVTLFPEASRAAQEIVRGLVPLIVGRDPRDRAAILADIEAHTWWYGVGGIASFAVSALDIALWDLTGKAEGATLVDLLGGAVHDSLPTLISCHAMEADLDEMAAMMADWVRATASIGIKIGMGKRGAAHLGDDADRDRTFVATLRRHLGPEPLIMMDVGAALHWDLETATARARDFADYGVDWLEEPLGADDPPGYAALRQHTDLRIAYGEREWTPRGIERIVATGTVDVVGVDPGRCEGITGWKAAQACTQAAQVEINAHAWSGAVVTAASLALSLTAPNCRQVEIKPLRDPMQHDLIDSPITPTDGRLFARKGAGLGISIREEVLASYHIGQSARGA